MENEYHNVLTIAGFDGSGGAGIQADLKTFSALGCYGMTVLTALPVQNTIGVRSIYNISPTCVKEQLMAIIEDISVSAIKIGMLHDESIIHVVADALREFNISKVVLDPVMIAKSGDRLLHPDAIAAMKERLFPLVSVLTPNLMECSEILGRSVENKTQMEQAAKDLSALGPGAIIVKGGHLNDSCDDCLFLQNKLGTEFHWFLQPKISTRNTHGTGCTFSSAIAAFLAKGLSVKEAVLHAKEYLTRSIQCGARFKTGRGNGPVHHFHHIWAS